MPSRGQTTTIQYVAWDTVANGPKTGDVANHTLRWVKDGTSSAPTNAAAEVDATNAKGVYSIVMTATECTCNCGTICGVSSTAGIVIIPLTVTFEQLPTAAPASSGGLPTFGTGSGQITASSGQVTVATNNDKTGYTVSTNSDKTGYTLTVTPPTAAQIATAIFTDTTGSDFTTSGSPGKILVTQLGGAFTTASSSVFSSTALANAPTGGSAPTVSQIATGVWQDLLAGGDFGTAGSIGILLANLSFVGSNLKAIVEAYGSGQDPATLVLDVAASSHNTAGTIGAKITTAAGAGDPLAVAVPGAYSAGTVGYLVGTYLNASVAAVKAKTDLIGTNSMDSPNAFTTQGLVAANLDTNVGSRSAPATAQTINFGTTVAETYPAKGAAFTLGNWMYHVAQNLVERGIVGTTLSIYKLDGATVAETFTLNDADNPALVHRAT